MGHAVKCDTCPASIFINATASAPRGLPDEAVVKRLNTRGWRVLKGGKSVKCDKCVRGKAPLLVQTTAGPSCLIEGCDAQLAIPVDGKGWASRDGMVNIPPSVVKGRAKAEGWAMVERGEFACPVHSQGYAGGKIILDYLAGGKRTPKWGAPLRQGETLETIMAAAEDAAALCYGDAWPGMKVKAESIAQDRQQLAELETIIAEQDAIIAQTESTTADTPAAPEGEPMSTTPTRDQKRTIMDFLNANYDENGWTGTWSDAKAAATLSMPRAWVQEIRAEFFGDADVNEEQRAADKARQREINQLKSDLKDANKTLNTALSALGDAEKAFTGLATRLAALETPKGN